MVLEPWITPSLFYPFLNKIQGDVAFDSHSFCEVMTKRGKEKGDPNYANKWMTTFNTSVSIWQNLQLYNDFGAVKNSGNSLFLAHESGLRLTLVHNILEFYLPIHSNNGWEMGLNNYSSKIRFTLVLDANRIFSFIRRGFL